ncbi:glycosyltransferase [Halobacillus litoralis]|uniref:Glycosyltransferase n=1 Tax=Halobacillus litoralis TaxID=45668 RepID=A0A845F6T3_9BACI|nr:glycosyltransferase [Halobacillus litoralis]MYL69823.1 glycosyltransferase [Halobacillus litoralis]
MEAKYSVLMSVYYKESPHFLKESIESMVRQTLKPDEIVIVKDGELNKELNIVIENFSSNHPGLFNIVELDNNLGLGKALDIGLENCKNELIARMDSDDISLHDRCKEQVKVFQNDPELCIIGTNIDEFYDEPTNVVSSRIVPTKHKDIKRFIKRRSPFNHPTVMFKKSKVLQSGGYGFLRRKQDLDLFSRMLNSGCKASNINKSLLLFRSNENSFKRRKSWDNCKSYIKVIYTIWKRGHCSTLDLIIVTIGQIVMFLAPMKLLKWISNSFLRERLN